jgi:putative metallohydrolase (TIGR04338 family)
MTSSAVRSDDPWAELVYAAHHHALDEVGPVFRRWVQLQDFVDRVTADDEWFESFENAPIEVTAERRSHSARYSVALTDQATILIRGGSWNAPIVLHELAHLAVPGVGHGAEFVGAHLFLVRRWCGFHAYGAYRSALDLRRVPYVNLSR